MLPVLPDLKNETKTKENGDQELCSQAFWRIQYGVSFSVLHKSNEILTILRPYFFRNYFVLL